VETDYLRTAPAQTSGTPRLRIRYDSLYPSAGGSGRYVMAHDSAIASGSGDWVFIPVNCLGH
jgi:hypothetical protein